MYCELRIFVFFGGQAVFWMILVWYGAGVGHPSTPIHYVFAIVFRNLFYWGSNVRCIHEHHMNY